ncbi:hypothetical protein [Amaricoccus macauensis]|uniref:calcium-binding protein n=1 Tax=Amaricoccus macauensis TaxID=57001 RepID=UPI003C7E361A
MAKSDSKSTIEGTRRGDYLEGTDANDRIYGYGGWDNLYGEEGNDTLYGGGKGDYLYGGRGKDKLIGGSGDDYLAGDGGNDTLNGGSGFDTASYADTLADVTVDLGNGTASFPNESWNAETLKSIEAIDFGAGNDTFIGTTGRNRAYGGSGDDFFVGYGGGDYFSGGNGFDTLSYEWVTGNLRINWDGTVIFRNSTAPNDSFYGIERVLSGTGDDQLNGSDDGNYLSGGNGDDTLLGRGGDDTLQGGSGEDLLDGGSGHDMADFSDDTDGLDIDLGEGYADFADSSSELLISLESAAGGKGKDTISGSGTGNYLYGDRGGDELYGRGGDDTLDGGGGTDTLDGGSGTDTVIYEGLSEGVVIDLEAGSAAFPNRNWGTETLTSIENAISGSGDDTLSGTDEANRLDGGAGNDVLNGRGGDDNLIISSGSDTVDGGEGYDRLIFDSAWDQSLEMRNYSSEYDELWASRTDYKIDLDALTVKTDGVSGALNVMSIEAYVSGSGDDTIYGSDDADEIYAGFGANSVRGRKGDDLIHGGSQSAAAGDYPYSTSSNNLPESEILIGGQGNDTIFGGGNEVRSEYYATQIDFRYYYAEDLLIGGSGDDELHAGWARNRMTGGSDADNFVFTDDVRSSGVSSSIVQPYAMEGTITDFDTSEGDHITIKRIVPEDENWQSATKPDVRWLGESGVTYAGDLAYEVSGNDTILRYAVVSERSPNQYWGYEAQALTITLEGYSGPLAESDILFA